MNVHAMNTQVKSFLDWAFLAGVVFALVLAGKIVPFLIVAGVAPIPFFLAALRRKKLTVSPGRLLIPAGIYFAYVLATYFFYTGLAPGAARPVNPDLELYGVGIAMLAVGLVRGLQVDDLRRKFDLAVPVVLIVSFVVLSVMMLGGFRDSCRVQAGAAWPFIPALIFGTLTFLSFTGWRTMSGRARTVRILLNALAIVVVVAYTSSRGIAVAQAGVLIVMSLIGFLPRLAGSVPSWKSLAISSALGVALCAAVSAITGCGSLERITPVFKAIGVLSATHADPASPGVQPPAAAAPAQPSATLPPAADQTLGASGTVREVMSADMSTGQRLEMWKTSIESIRQAPVFGHGALYLQHLITERYGFEHNHNQYLSWLVTGGIVGLSIGLLFLAIPWFVSFGLETADRLIVTLAVSVFWGLAIMFDSYFNLKFYTHYYCLLCGLLYAVVNDTAARHEAEDRLS